jgi:hypothetical protein
MTTSAEIIDGTPADFITVDLFDGDGGGGDCDISTGRGRIERTDFSSA